MKVFVSSLDVPIGYSTPKFPSLYWPLGPSSSSYQNLFLYYSFDVWEFTVFWSLILYSGVYLAVGSLAAFNLGLDHFRFNHFQSELPSQPKSQNEEVQQEQKRTYMKKSISPYHRFNIFNALIIIGIYFFLGLLQGFISGAIIGALLLAIYKAGSLTMSCWIPLCWGFALILFNICSSYRTSSLIL